MFRGREEATLSDRMAGKEVKQPGVAGGVSSVRLRSSSPRRWILRVLSADYVTDPQQSFEL